jgi:hypothetical protein
MNTFSEPHLRAVEFARNQSLKQHTCRQLASRAKREERLVTLKEKHGQEKHDSWTRVLSFFSNTRYQKNRQL